MRTRTAVSIALIGCFLFALVGPIGSASAKPAKPTVVGKDEPGDWGSNVDPTIAPVGDFLGQELLQASIGMADAKTINFVITVNSLPPWGGIPESSRYNWDFNIDGNAYQLTGAWTEFLRGTCNPLHTNSCPPPSATEPQTFFLRQGTCLVGADCFVVDRVVATFDPAAATITIPVTLKSIKGQPGSKIGPAASSLGGGVYATPAAVVSQGSLPNDTLIVTGTYVVPK